MEINFNEKIEDISMILLSAERYALMNVIKNAGCSY